MSAAAAIASAAPGRFARLSAFLADVPRVYAFILLVVCVATVVVALQSFRAIDRELTEAALSKNTALAELAAVTLSEKFDRLVDISVSLADRVRFRELIGVGRWSEAADILSGVRAEFPFVDRITLNEVDGTQRAAVPHVPETIGRNFAMRDWYKGVSRTWKPYVSDVYTRYAGDAVNVFGIAAPIRSKEGRLLGSILLQVRLDTLFDWTRRVDIGDEGFIYVVDRSGRVAFHPRLPPQGSLVDLSAESAVRLALDGRKGTEVSATGPQVGVEAVKAYEPVPKYGWAVIAEQPARAAFATRDHQLKRLLLAYGLAGLFWISAIYLVLRIAIHRRKAQEDHRVKAELERRVAERTAQLGAVTDTANDAIVSADQEGRIVYFNRGAERTFGFSAGEVAGQPLTILMPERFREAHRAGFQRHIATGESRVIGKTIELTAHRRNGTEFPVEISIANWSTTEGRFFTAILRDITDRRAAEEALKAINKELESFSYSVSHDLRSPLRAIDGFARILAEDYGAKVDDEGRRLLGVVRDNSRKMGQLIDDLLAFSRIGRKPLSAAPIDMKRLVEEVVKDLAASGESSPNVELKVLPAAHGDVALLKQAWANLLANAVKFSGKRERPMIEVSGREHGAETVYCVKDNGVGFDMRFYDKLFGVFQRLHHADEFPGTGVGLAIVQRVVSRHGGRVWAEGEPDRGASFYFSLPREAHNGEI